MSDTMVDRCIKAMLVWRELPEGCRLNTAAFRADVEAVIAAMLNPTNAMQAAARDALSEWLPRGEIAKPATDQWQPAREVYQAAVRAAIEEARTA